MPDEAPVAVAPISVALGVPASAVAAAIAGPAAVQVEGATSAGPAAAVAVAEAAPVDPDTEGADPVEPQVNTDTLRDLLKALGHDIGDVWDDVVKLAKKAI